MRLRALLASLLAFFVGIAGAALVAAPAHAAPVVVTGSVIDADSGDGIADAYVEAEGPDFVDTATAEDGSFSLSVEPGTYWLYADADGYQSTSFEFEITSATTSLPAIELEPALTVTGAVVDDATGEGVPEAEVEAEGPDYDYAMADASGAYSLELVPGSYTVWASAPNYEGASIEVDVTEATTSLPTIELTALPDPIALTGTVVDSGTDDGIAYAQVHDDGWAHEAQTDETGAYEIAVQPGTYTFEAEAEGYHPNSVTLEITEESTVIPPIALDVMEPGIYVSVGNETFGGPAANAQVVLQPAGGGAATTKATDTEGETFFSNLAPGDYTVSVQAGNGLEQSGESVQVSYAEGFEYVELAVVADLTCEPATVNPALTNMGFESGMDGWTLGYQTESIQSVGADAFTSPWEGSKMARLGHSKVNDDGNQAEGPNIMCQDFEVDNAEETFAFNVFTYDYTGFDQFRFDVIVTDPDTGETLAAYEQGAWGEGTDLKTSGWRGVRLDLADHVGETVRLSFRAGGTEDSAFAFWAYLDSAANLPAPVELSDTVVTSETGSVTTDPSTGQVTVSMPTGSPSALTMQLPAECESGAAPTAVGLLLNGNTYAGIPVGSKWSVTVPEEDIASGPLSMQIECEEETTQVVPIGQIVLYDPSGNVTDAATDAPVVGAKVRLYKVPSWSPKTTPGAPGPEQCETNESKGDAPWSQAAPTELGQLVNAASPEISPNVNPFITNNEGYYGWNVAEGCWYVTVEAAGYQSLTSPVVGVPSEVTDLHLELTKVAKPGPSPACVGAKAGLVTAQAALTKAMTKVKKAKAGLKKAKKSGSKAKVKKAKKKLKKAKAGAKKATTGLANAKVNVGKHC